MQANHDLGRVSWNLKGSIEAGSWQTLVVTYTAGFAGIDDTGSLKFVTRYATDAGVPQFDEPTGPGFTTAVASNGARLQLRYDVKDFRRPWGKTIHVKVLQGYLSAGDTITLTIGDTSQGSPGWRMQTFVEDTFELKAFVDRYATYVYEELPRSPTFRITAGDPVRLVAVAPSQAEPGQRIPIRWKLEDKWGNVAGRPRRQTLPGLPTGIHRLQIRDDKTGLAAETNPVSVSTNPATKFWADLHGQSEETIGTNSIDSYFRFARDSAFVDVCGHQGNDFQITSDFWHEINDTTARFNETGKFVAFPGWEWSGNTGLGGDRNVFFKHEGGPICRSSLALVADEDDAGVCSSVEDLFRRMNREGKQRDVMLVPHVGGRYADMQRHDAFLEPVVEVHSAWGTFEWMLADSFENGYRIGIVGNSDGHKGRPGASYPGASTFGSYGGLTGILADTLDRDAIWQAYQHRHVYATTGARILLDVTTSDGQIMGDELRLRDDREIELSIEVAGTAAIERIELRNAMHVMRTFRTYGQKDLGNRIKLLWQGAAVRGRGRQVNWDGNLTLSQARLQSFVSINFWNAEKRCQQVNARKLRWESSTTGGVAGVILELNRLQGELSVETTPKNFRIELPTLSMTGRRFKVAGLEKQVSVYRLPNAGGTREFRTTTTIHRDQLQPGDNPLYVCVVQEDGHMAWSSPIYVIR